jgi:hypothetical protein
MTHYRRKLMLCAILTASCLFETVGCPQLLGNAFREGTRSFFDNELTSLLLSSLNLDELFGQHSEP